MNRKLLVAAVACGLLVFSGLAMAQPTKDPNLVGIRENPANFQPLVGPYCSSPGASIPDDDSGILTDTLNVPDSVIIADLDVQVQIAHTWLGDLRGSLAGPGCSLQLWHRIGIDDDTCCGCSGDDMDVTFDDEAGDSIENSCGSGANGGAAGPWQPGDPVNFPADSLDACDGSDAQGDWTLTVTDGAAGDTGTLDTWCLVVDDGGTGDGTGGDGTGVPAVSTWGIVALIALFLGISLYYMRRRSTAGA